MTNGLSKKPEKQRPLQKHQKIYCWVTLTKQVKDLDDKNVKSLRKEIKVFFIRTWKAIPWSLTGKNDLPMESNLQI